MAAEEKVVIEMEMDPELPEIVQMLVRMLAHVLAAEGYTGRFIFEPRASEVEDE